MRVWPSILLALMTGACQPDQPDTACANRTFEGDVFTSCEYDPDRHTLSMAWKSPGGGSYRSFAALSTDVPAGSIIFAMNAGMYDDAGAPIGLFVENGHETRSLNTASGSGNFHLSPNGVFWTDANGVAHVLTTAAFQQAGPKPAFASQSGPMLVIGGALHPTVSHDGVSRYTRNGVGADCEGRSFFVISAQPVSFGKLARFFRDALQCRNALYFDGAVSSLWAPSLNRMDAHASLGPIVMVARKQKGGT